jgi:signal peptidase I, bacterial type
MQPSKRTAFLKDLRRLLLLAALILTGRSVLADWYVVPTGSMKPTILEGDRVFVLKAAYQVRVPFSRMSLFATGLPRRGDVVVLRNPDGGTVPFVKRLIGLPGDAVEIRDGVLHVNGAEQASEFLPPVEGPDGHPVLVGTERLSGTPHPVRLLPDHPNAVRSWGPMVVPEGEVLVLGDNRDESRDGRYFGTRPIGDLLGRAVGVFWSWDPEWTRGPRWNRFVRPFRTEPGPETPAPIARQRRERDPIVTSPV